MDKSSEKLSPKRRKKKQRTTAATPWESIFTVASQRRQTRVNEEMQKALWKIIRDESELDELVSILEVKTSVDLQWADVYVSVFPFENRVRVVSYLSKRAPYFQALLNKALNIKHTPKIRFKADVRLQLEDYGNNVMGI